MSGVRDTLLERQAEAVGFPLIKVWVPARCSNDRYERLMETTLSSRAFEGIDHIAFADLFLSDLRAHREERLATVGKHGVFPIWGRDTSMLSRETVAAGFKATVVTVDPRALDASFAGRPFDEAFLRDLPPGVDPCGENGEFHTFVWDAPLFDAPIACRTDQVVERDGFVYCDVVPVD
jgi:uncharacterized protein (TIGR00290 family)